MAKSFLGATGTFLMKILVYDGSFDGLMSAIYDVFDYKYSEVELVAQSNFTNEILFAEVITIETDPAKAGPVLAKIEKLLGNEAVNTLLKVFLSEQQGREQLILKAVRAIVAQPGINIFQNFGDDGILKIAKIVKSMGREIHRMHAFVRFEKLQDGTFFSVIEPDFDVMPLIFSHFKKRYADQQWMIFDAKRHYGVLYDLQDVHYFHPDEATLQNLKNSVAFHHEEEQHFQKMWQNYFIKTGIPSRKNTKLHVQHVPKRYWKYLTEKV